MTDNLEEWQKIVEKYLGHKDFLIIYKPMAAKFGVYDLQNEVFSGVVAWTDMTLLECFAKWHKEWVEL